MLFARMPIYDSANLFQGQVALSLRRGLCDFVAWTEVTVDGFIWWKIQSRKQSAVIMLFYRFKNVSCMYNRKVLP